MKLKIRAFTILLLLVLGALILSSYKTARFPSKEDIFKKVSNYKYKEINKFSILEINKVDTTEKKILEVKLFYDSKHIGNYTFHGYRNGQTNSVTEFLKE